MGKPRKLASTFVVAYALLSAFASDCVAQGIMEQFRSVTEVYPIPETIAGDTTRNGLLMIDASMTRAAGGYTLDGAAIATDAVPGEEILAGSFSVRGVFLPRSASTAVFANLTPGTYRIIRMRFSNGNGSVVVNPDDLSVEVRSGEVSYLGRLVASQRMFSTQINYAINADPEREALAWRQVLAKFGETPWTPVVQARLEALASPTSEEHPSTTPSN